MGLRTWIRQRLSPRPARVDLVEPSAVTLEAPAWAGLSSAEVPAPWSVARLQALFEAMEHQPSTSSDRAARLARHQLSRFWLAAPVDALQGLYDGEIGDLQRLQLTGPLMQQQLAEDERRWRDQLLARLDDPDRAPERLNLLLAVMPYTQPRKLRVAEPLSSLPDWLHNDYIVYCEPDLAAPVGLLEPAADGLQPLTERRGEQAMEWFRDSTVVERMQELIAGFSADPSDAALHGELAGLRRVLAQLWLDVEPIQLETLNSTAVGPVTTALIAAGFGSVLVDDQDRRDREQLGSFAMDFSRPGAAGAVLAALLYYPPSGVTFESTEGLPEWLVALLEQLAAEG